MSSINVIYLITEMSVENEQKDFCLKKKKKSVCSDSYMAHPVTCKPDTSLTVIY